MASATAKKTRKDGEVDGPFDHPVYKKLSQLNGEINKMTKEELKSALTSLKLDTRGVKEVLKKRLKAYYRRTKTKAAGVKSRVEPRCDFFMVIDFEATCQEINGADWVHEIIEFPVVLVNAHTNEVEDEFHSFVKPVLNDKLTPFCTSLTGISQNDVDCSPTFPDVLQQVEEWMGRHGLNGQKKAAVVTDGPWDVSRFLYIQCQVSKIPLPKWARKWVNLRKAYCTFYGLKKVKLVTMLENLGLAFEGHEHSGKDDSRNIARIAQNMLTDGCDLHINERLFQYKLEKLSSNTYQRSEIISVARNEGSCSETDSDESVVFEERSQECISGQGSQKLEEAMSDLSLQDKSSEENCDDLLRYYALQNKKR